MSKNGIVAGSITTKIIKKKKQFQSAFIKLPLLFYMEMKKKGGMLAI